MTFSLPLHHVRTPHLLPCHILLSIFTKFVARQMTTLPSFGVISTASRSVGNLGSILTFWTRNQLVSSRPGEGGASTPLQGMSPSAL
jgi:hypothetical protein